MLVDNSIVVLESIQRFRERGENLFNASLHGTSEVAGAVTASTFTTVAVFFPIVFVEGIAGQLFKDMALTVTFSLLASLLISITLVPMLNSAMVRDKKKRGNGNLLNKIFLPFDTLYNILFSLYKKLRDIAFSKKTLVLISALLLLIFSVFLSKYMGQELIPVISQGEFYINIEFEPGTSLSENSSVISGVYKKLKDYDEIDSIYQLAGKGSAGGISFQEERENLSEFTIRLKPGIIGKAEDRVMDRVRKDLVYFTKMKYKVHKPRLFSF